MTDTDLDDRLRRGMRRVADGTRAEPDIGRVVRRATATVDDPFDGLATSGSSARRLVWCVAAAAIAIVVTVALAGRADAAVGTEVAFDGTASGAVVAPACRPASS